MGARYLKAEEAVIRARYPTSRRWQILALIPGRTWVEICAKARKMGIHRTKAAKGDSICEGRKLSRYLWSDSDNVKFDLLYPTATHEQLLNTFHTKTWISIRSHAEKRRIHRTKEAKARQVKIGREKAKKR
jgi:hypothetical protein